MNQNNVIPISKPDQSDPLTALLRDGARKLLAQAVDAELETFLAAYADLKDERGRRSVVRNGYLPERQVMTGIGEVNVQVPKTRDRSGSGLHFRSSLIPPYLKRTKSVETLLPVLYLKGISTGDFQEALGALLGEDASGLSAATISRLKATWQTEYEDWKRRDLSKSRYVYLWADGIYFNVRSDDDKQCILVVIGATENVYNAKYPQAVECIEKDVDDLLTFYDFPAVHWQHLRTTNPIESTFATVRLRTAKTRGSLSRNTTLTMVFKLGQSAEKGWLRLRGYRRLGDVIRGVKCIDGIEEEKVNKGRKVA